MNVENSIIVLGFVDIYFVVKIGVKPAIKYPIEFFLKLNRGRFIGLYWEVGDGMVLVGIF